MNEKEVSRNSIIKKVISGAFFFTMKFNRTGSVKMENVRFN